MKSEVDDGGCHKKVNGSNRGKTLLEADDGRLWLLLLLGRVFRALDGDNTDTDIVVIYIQLRGWRSCSIWRLHVTGSTICLQAHRMRQLCGGSHCRSHHVAVAIGQRVDGLLQ